MHPFYLAVRISHRDNNNFIKVQVADHPPSYRMQKKPDSNGFSSSSLVISLQSIWILAVASLGEVIVIIYGRAG